MAHTYRYVPPLRSGYVQAGRKDPGEWYEVGTYVPGASNAFHQRMEWHGIKIFKTENEAAAYTHYLNGKS